MEKRLVNSLHSWAEKLVGVANELKTTARNSGTPQEIEALQKEQERIIGELQKLDEKVQASESFDESSEEWQTFIAKLREFEALNEEFIQDVSVRKGLIKFDLMELRKAKADLAKMKKSYVKAPKKGKSKGINTSG